MENIIVEINSKKYLLVEIAIVDDKSQRKVNESMKAFGCIFQGIKEIKQASFFSKGYAIVKLLVPEENVIAFNNCD